MMLIMQWPFSMMLFQYLFRPLYYMYSPTRNHFFLLYSQIKETCVWKNHAHANYKSSVSIFDYHNFSLCLARYKFFSKQCYRDFRKQPYFEFSVLLEFCIKKSFIFNNSRKCEFRCCLKFQYVNLFSQFFYSVYTPLTMFAFHVKIPTSPYNPPSNVIITVDDVFVGLARFRNKTSIGSNGIYTLKKGVFLSILKIGFITTILKMGRWSYLRP